jgi:hypothetical protein
MGCWNGTCLASNLHVCANKDVAVFMLLENQEKGSFCYSNALYDVCPVPFYGQYDDYGAVEKCHGFGLNLVVEAIREKLYEFGEGPNSCHDIIVNKKNFDLEKMFEADHEDRLGIHEPHRWSSDEYNYQALEKQRLDSGLNESQMFELDRLANKLKQQDDFRRVTHVIIHGDIFRSILEKWYIEEYVGEGGNAGFDNHYVHIYFKDLVSFIPLYVEKLKEEFEKEKSKNEIMAKAGFTFFHMRIDSIFDWNDENLAGKWMSYFDKGSSHTWGLINVKEYVLKYMEQEKWDELALFTKEVLTAAWINSFMMYTRKTWSQTCGRGSQSQELTGYRVLSESILEVIENERKEYCEEEEDIEELEAKDA